MLLEDDPGRRAREMDRYRCTSVDDGRRRCQLMVGHRYNHAVMLGAASYLRWGDDGTVHPERDDRPVGCGRKARLPGRRPSRALRTELFVVTPPAEGSSRPGRPASSARAVAVRARRSAYRESVGDGQAFDALRAQLQRARELEWAADTADRRLAAQAGTARLVQAARAGRWSVADIADALEVTRATVTARLRLLDAAAPVPGGVTVPARPRAAPRRRPGPPPAGEGWLTPGQACLLAGVRHRSLTRWRLAGLLPGSRCSEGGRWLYRREDLEAVVARRAGRTGLPGGTFTVKSGVVPHGLRR